MKPKFWVIILKYYRMVRLTNYNCLFHLESQWIQFCEYILKNVQPFLLEAMKVWLCLILSAVGQTIFQEDSDCDLYKTCRYVNSCFGNFYYNNCYASNRCGEQLSPPFVCACDENCSYFGDCCEDFSSLCQETTIPTFFQNNYKSFLCISIPRIF